MSPKVFIGVIFLDPNIDVDLEKSFIVGEGFKSVESLTIKDQTYMQHPLLYIYSKQVLDAHRVNGWMTGQFHLV